MIWRKNVTNDPPYEQQSSDTLIIMNLLLINILKNVLFFINEVRIVPIQNKSAKEALFNKKSWVFSTTSIMDCQLSRQKLVKNMNSGVSVVFKTKSELKCQNELFLKYHFTGNTSVSGFITEIIWWTFDVIIDDP